MGYVLLIFVVILIAVIISNKRAKKRFEQTKEREGYDNGIYDAVYRYGLPNIKEHSFVNVYANDKELVIEHKDVKYQIDLEKITAIEFVSEVDQLEKNKSALARSVAGGLALGPLGAIAGAASGVGKKKEKGSFLVINYKSDGEIKVIILKVQARISKTIKFVKEMQDKIIKLHSEDGVIKL